MPKITKTKKPHRKAIGSTYNGGAPRTNLQKMTPFHKKLAVRLWNKRSECQKQGKPFDLDVDWVLQQVPVCAVTGALLVVGGKTGPLTPSFDQIVAAAGYTKNNVRIVAQWYNIAKNQWPDAEIKKLIIAASDHIKTVKNEEY